MELLLIDLRFKKRKKGCKLIEKVSWVHKTGIFRAPASASHCAWQVRVRLLESVLCGRAVSWLPPLLWEVIMALGET